MTYGELLSRAEDLGANCAEVALGRMMDIVEEESGVSPNWDDEAPDWVEEMF